MMVDADRGIKTCMYKLQKLKGSEFYISLLQKDVDREIHVIAGVPYCCKVEVVGHKAPLNLGFTHFDNSDLSFAGSFTNKDPIKGNCDVFRKNRPNNIRAYLMMGSEVTFGRTQCFYIAFLSDFGAKFKIKPTFPDEKKVNKKQPKIANYDT